MKKFLAIALATLFCASMFAVSVPAASANPTKILEESTFVTKSVVNFDEANINDMLDVNAERSTWEIVDGAGANGKALKMTNGNNTSEGNILFEESDWSEWDGLIWYLDLTNVVYNATEVAAGKTGGAPIRIHSNFHSSYSWTRNTDAGGPENFDIATYYLADGTTEWKKSDNTAQNGERFNLPQGFKGWVYVPFTSYITRKGPDGTPVVGIYGAEGISKITILSGPHDLSEGAAKTSIIVDEIQLVKLGTTTPPGATTEAPTVATTEATTVATTVATTAATTAEATTAATTAAATTEAPKSGCGSSITVASVAVVMTSVLGSALVIKKRK